MKSKMSIHSEKVLMSVHQVMVRLHIFARNENIAKICKRTISLNELYECSSLAFMATSGGHFSRPLGMGPL